VIVITSALAVARRVAARNTAQFDAPQAANRLKKPST
jgi:hypothetical protein